MAAFISGNTEAGFVFATLVEFIHLWGSGKDATINIKCTEGQAKLSMECNLGNPGDQHVQVPVKVKSSKKSKKSKSASRTARNNARAARHQAAAGPPPPPPPTTTTLPRTVTSLAPAPTPPARPATSPALSVTERPVTTHQAISSLLSSSSEEPVNASQVITDLELWREIQLCSARPPHSCEEFYRTATEEEIEVLQRWNTLSLEQARGTRRRPDLKQHLSEEGFYPLSFYCSALRKIRPESLRIESGDTQDKTERTVRQDYEQNKNRKPTPKRL